MAFLYMKELFMLIMFVKGIFVFVTFYLFGF